MVYYGDVMLIYTNTKSKIKPKQKTKAERTEYEAWCAKHGINPYGKTKVKPATVRGKNPVVVTGVYRRETPVIKSLDTGVTGATTWNNQKKVYTGDKLIGIATMHKSNLVPIFQEEAAKEVSQMRRG